MDTFSTIFNNCVSGPEWEALGTLIEEDFLGDSLKWKDCSVVTTAGGFEMITRVILFDMNPWKQKNVVAQ